MRKLRAWVIKEKKMYYKDIFLWPAITNSDHTKWYVYSQESMHNPILLGELNTEVIVMESIIPDKTGKLMFANDVARVPSASFNANKLEIIWGGPLKQCAYGLYGKRKKIDKWDLDCVWEILTPETARDCEVIGNRHENPGMIKEIEL